MIDTKHKKLPTDYKDTMRPQQAIRSDTDNGAARVSAARGGP